MAWGVGWCGGSWFGLWREFGNGMTRAVRMSTAMRVAGGPRFLKCYDGRARVGNDFGVAAGPRFLKCYDVEANCQPFPELQLDRVFLNAMAPPGFASAANKLQLHRDFGNAMTRSHVGRVSCGQRVCTCV